MKISLENNSENLSVTGLHFETTRTLNSNRKDGVTNHLKAKGVSDDASALNFIEYYRVDCKINAYRPVKRQPPSLLSLHLNKKYLERVEKNQKAAARLSYDIRTIS